MSTPMATGLDTNESGWFELKHGGRVLVGFVPYGKLQALRARQQASLIDAAARATPERKEYARTIMRDVGAADVVDDSTLSFILHNADADFMEENAETNREIARWCIKGIDGLDVAAVELEDTQYMSRGPYTVLSDKTLDALESRGLTDECAAHAVGFWSMSADDKKKLNNSVAPIPNNIRAAIAQNLEDLDA